MSALLKYPKAKVSPAIPIIAEVGGILPGTYHKRDDRPARMKQAAKCRYFSMDGEYSGPR